MTLSLLKLLKSFFTPQNFSVKRSICGKNNSIAFNSASLKNVSFKINGDNNTIKIKEKAKLKNVSFKIKGNNHKIIIGNGVRFNRGGLIWFEDENCTLTIDENSTFEDVHLAVTEPNSSIIIGKECMFAYDIDVRTGDSHSIISSETGERLNYAEDVCIGNHVWVAAHCKILKGSKIGDDSVIATGSIVTRKFNDKNVILGGSPAKIIKEKINWSRERVNKSF